LNFSGISIILVIVTGILKTFKFSDSCCRILIWNKDFEFKNAGNRFADLFMGKQVC